VTRPNDNSVSLQPYFDAGWEREIRPVMGEGRVTQGTLFYGFSLAGVHDAARPFRTTIFSRNLLRRHSPDVRRPHAELRTKEIAEMG
jgi:hypothetical protein